MAQDDMVTTWKWIWFKNKFPALIHYKYSKPSNF
jgi:hypothetical protein